MERMKAPFQVNDKVEVRQKNTLSWHKATITEVGWDNNGDFWASYELNIPVGSFGYYWRTGIYYASIDPNCLDIILIQSEKKKYKLLFHATKHYHYLEETK